MSTLFKRSAAVGALALGVLGVVGTAPAQANSNDAVATQALTSQVYTVISNNDYSKENGGFTKGSQLLTQDENGIYQLVDAEYQALSTQGRSQLVSDIYDATQQAKKDGSSAGITDNTVTNWYKSLQNTNGVGSQLLAKVLENTKPDITKGAMIYAPFSGPISTAMGFFTILIFGLLGLTVVLDLLYIVVPMARLAFGTGKNNDGDSKSKGMPDVISFAARSAVAAEEGGDSSNGSGGNNGNGGKSAIFIYFKKTFVKYLALGFALVYLISGQLWTFIGWMLDLVGKTIMF